jgi:hypothetical protein
MNIPTAQIPRLTAVFCLTAFLILSIVPQSVEPTSAKAVPAPTEPAATTTNKPKLDASRAYGNLPLSFEPNHGQADKRVKFLSRGAGHSLFLTATEAWLTLSNSENEIQTVRMKIVGGSRSAQMSGENLLPGRSNYLVGDRKNWKTDLQTYSKVRANQIYPGIDLVYYGSDQRRFEYDFIVAPNVDPRQIQLAFDGVDEISLDAEGGLRLKAQAGEVVQPAPVIYQELAGQRQAVKGRFLLLGDKRVAFEIGDYDHNQTLVIDPQLVYSSYHGGNGDDRGEGIAVDNFGNAYITGSTLSSNLVPNPSLQPNQSGMDAFVTKVNSTGTEIIYSTYLGGSGTDFGRAIAVTADNKACVTGASETEAEGFPLRNEYQDYPWLFERNLDVFVTVLNDQGNAVIYSTFLGGENVDTGNGIALDAADNIYVTGTTLSRDFPTKREFQRRNPYMAAFVAKFNPREEGNDSLVYSSFLGGDADDDLGEAIAVTAAGVAFVTGVTESDDFLVKSSSSFPPLQGNFGEGVSDAFVAKVSPTGDLIYSTYFGGDGTDEGVAIAVDVNERAYITGTTTSNGLTFPLRNAFDSTRAGDRDSFVAKLNADGTTLFYSSFITGGDLVTDAAGLGIDAAGSAYVTGFMLTRSIPFPVVNGFPSTVPNGNMFLVKVGPSDATGTTIPQILMSDAFMSCGPLGLTLDKRGNIYIAGSTTNANQATPGAFQQALVGQPNDAFVLKITSTLPDTIGTFRPASSLFLLRNSNTAGNSDINIEFGQSGDLPVAGDWDGNGVTDVGVFRPSRGEFVLRVPQGGNTFSTITVNFGAPGDLPVAGDWNGDGIDTPGVFRPGSVGTFLLTNTITNGSAPSPDIVFSFGVNGDRPVAGDWDGDTVDTIGVFRTNGVGEFHLSNDFENSTDIFFNFGTKGDLPLAGDWTGKGFDTVGVFRPGKSTMFLANNFANVADLFFVFGQSGDLPLAGNWDGQ